MMQRFRHPAQWVPGKRKQFFAYWDKCDYCKGRIQTYKEAIRYVELEIHKYEPLFKDYVEAVERDTPPRAPDREGKLPWEE